MSGVEIALLGTVVLGAATSIMQGVAAKSAGEANAQAAETQEAITRRQGAAEEAQVRRENRLTRGRQVAAIAESGLALTGSPLDLIDEDSVTGELDALTVRYQTDLEAMGLQYQAQVERHRGRQGFVQGLVGAGAAVAEGASAGYARGLFGSTAGSSSSVSMLRSPALTGPTGKLGGPV